MSNNTLDVKESFKQFVSKKLVEALNGNKSTKDWTPEMKAAYITEEIFSQPNLKELFTEKEKPAFTINTKESEAKAKVGITLQNKPCYCEKGDFLCYPEDGECTCGQYKHHVHCKLCGKIMQYG